MSALIRTPSKAKLAPEDADVNAGPPPRFQNPVVVSSTLQGIILEYIDTKRDDTPVVLKLYNKALVEMGTDWNGAYIPENFYTEARIHQYLSSQKDTHPSIVKMIEVGTTADDYFHYIASEKCNGEPLFDYCNICYTTKINILDRRTVQRWFRQMVEGVGYMHSHKICHGDLSLENIMLNVPISHVCTKSPGVITKSRSQLEGETSPFFEELKQDSDVAAPMDTLQKQPSIVGQLDGGEGHTLRASIRDVGTWIHGELFDIKIIDFAVARQFESNDFSTQKRYRKTHYMSPEAYDGKSYDARSDDVWALGVILFTMLVGAFPFVVPSSKFDKCFKYIYAHGKLDNLLELWQRKTWLPKSAIDLLSAIFKPEKQRITIPQILNHSFVKDKLDKFSDHLAAEPNRALRAVSLSQFGVHQKQRLVNKKAENTELKPVNEMNASQKNVNEILAQQRKESQTQMSTERRP